MLLVVCPNLAIDRILQVGNLTPGAVQRSRQAVVQPGGKGSNAARVFRQLGGDVVLLGFVGSRNGSAVTEPLRRIGIHVDTVAAYEETRTCTIICDASRASHPTVINEESPEVEPAAAAKLLRKVERWIGRADGVLTTGSLSTGLPVTLYAEIIDRARRRGKFTAIDATGAALRAGLAARPDFMKPNTGEMRELLASSAISTLAAHTAITFGNAGAIVLNEGQCLFAPPPRIFTANPIGAGDAFAAGYLKSLLEHRPVTECFRLALAAAASDAGTLRPGFIDRSQLAVLAAAVEYRFTPSF
ncbi:MAG TPA: PfkB family carbohydrate kinase [Terriglobia bacterium]|jgi:1-phosphofructokinase family hexose kinase